jgi:hypothetical protein
VLTALLGGMSIADCRLPWREFAKGWRAASVKVGLRKAPFPEVSGIWISKERAPTISAFGNEHKSTDHLLDQPACFVCDEATVHLSPVPNERVGHAA